MDLGVGKILELINKQGGVCILDEGGVLSLRGGVLTLGRREVRESNIMVSLWLATMIVSYIKDSVSASE